MESTFTTFKPQNDLLAKYIDYYYLEVNLENKTRKYLCFPHLNNAVSIYSNHTPKSYTTPEGILSHEVTFSENASILQVFSPIRHDVFQVIQNGSLHRVVIIFKPLGIQQFFRDVDPSTISYSNLFTDSETNILLSTNDPEVLVNALDSFLLNRFKEYKNPITETTIEAIIQDGEDFKVEQCANELGISRRHLNRVFKSTLGLPVKVLHEIVMFRKSINQKLLIDPEISFTELAHWCNYNDQSHMNKVFKKFTRHSPKNFFSKGNRMGEADTFWHNK